MVGASHEMDPVNRVFFVGEDFECVMFTGGCRTDCEDGAAGKNKATYGVDVCKLVFHIFISFSHLICIVYHKNFFEKSQGSLSDYPEKKDEIKAIVETITNKLSAAMIDGRQFIGARRRQVRQRDGREVGAE